MELKKLKRMHDKAYNSGLVTRERAADDSVFYWVTQWDDNLLGETQLQYRGEFNILRKAGRQIMADLRANPIQVDFDPKDSTREDGADLIDGLYRSDDRINTSIEAYDNASAEAVVCGVGAWELYTEYATNRAGNDNQVIRRRPIYEANNNCYWDPNAKRLDKSDANYCSILTAYSEEGYEELVEELTGEEFTGNIMDSFRTPEESYAFPWAAGQNQSIYVVCFYYREKVKDKVLTLEDPLGQTMLLRESDLTEIMDELIDDGYTIDDEQTREIERWQVTKYIASGSRILKEYPIAGENIPVVPTYGERSFVESEEHYEGVTRLAKDPQRLRNFQMSYLADIVSRSPRPKPIFFPEQLKKYEFMYEETGSDNNFPYLLQNRLDAATGQPLPIGPVAQMPEQQIPQALIASIDYARQAVDDVANPGLPQDIADPDLSGKAVLALQNRLDQQSIVYQQNLKHAKRRDGEIYASMAADVFDSPRELTMTAADGSRKKVQTMQSIMDEETGEMIVLNDLTNMEFEVYADIGASYASQKEQTIETLGSMAQMVAAADPIMMKSLILKQMTLIDGVDMTDIRDYARKQLILSGIIEPDTDEEIQMMQAAQQNQPPDANMALAMAEQGKAQAAQADVQRKARQDQFNTMTDQAKVEVQQFEAQTKRMAVQVDAQEANANINFKRIDSLTKRMSVNNQSLRARVNQPTMAQ